MYTPPRPNKYVAWGLSILFAGTGHLYMSAFMHDGRGSREGIGLCVAQSIILNGMINNFHPVLLAYFIILAAAALLTVSKLLLGQSWEVM